MCQCADVLIKKMPVIAKNDFAYFRQWSFEATILTALAVIPCYGA
jgi:hypothetical protein